jgi:hypothetical protein
VASANPSAVAIVQGDQGVAGPPGGNHGSSGDQAPIRGLDPGGIAGSVIHEAATSVSTVVKPAAAAAVAATFSFPLVLMFAVLFFLLVQRRLDDRDPKLRAAPRSQAEAWLEFEEEDRL